MAVLTNPPAALEASAIAFHLSCPRAAKASVCPQDPHCGGEILFRRMSGEASQPRHPGRQGRKLEIVAQPLFPFPSFGLEVSQASQDERWGTRVFSGDYWKRTEKSGIAEYSLKIVV